MAKNISLLDATLRDGGQGLEDGNRNHFYDATFDAHFLQTIIEDLVKTDIEYIELGTIGPSVDDKTSFSIYQNIQDLSKTIPVNRNPKQMYLGLYIGPDTDVNDIPEWNSDLVEGVRVILRYSELQKSLDYCEALVKKGYKVFVQPMLTMRYTDEDLDLIIEASNRMGAYALYFVDSYGYMTYKDIDRLFNYYDARLNKDICIGFHAHNNMNMAYANVLHFMELDTNRHLLIDSCALGMGQGAGNLQTELIVPHLCAHYGKHYNYNAVLNVCEKIETRFLQDNEWGYSIMRLLPALHRAAYKYAIVMRKRYGLSYKEINTILSHMSEDYKQRYTEDRVKELIKK